MEGTTLRIQNGSRAHAESLHLLLAEYKTDVVQQNGPTEHHIWEAGKAYWLPVNAPGTMHTDVNVGSKSVVVMVVELKKDH